MKPYSKYFELGPTFVGNRRDLNDFNEDEDRLSDTEFNNYSTSSSNKTFTELSPFKTSLKFNRCNDDSIFDSYRTMSPLGQIIKNHSRSKMTRQKSPICLSFERKTKSKKVVINNQIPMEAQSKYELQDTETSQVTSLDRKKNINEIENELLTKLSAANHTVLNAISESEAYLINVPVKKEEHLTNCLRLPKTADFHEVIPLTFIKHQRKYQCQGVDAMLVMLGWHSTWTRFLVPKIEDFYQLSKQAAERSDFVLGYSIIGKRMHPYAAFDFDKNIDTWFMEGERVFFGYAIGISVKNDDKWNKVGPGNVSVYKKNNVLWMCSLGRSKFKPWASSEAPKLLAMGIVLSFSCQEGDGFIQSININLCLNEFCLEMTAKDIAVLKTLLV